MIAPATTEEHLRTCRAHQIRNREVGRVATRICIPLQPRIHDIQAFDVVERADRLHRIPSIIAREDELPSPIGVHRSRVAHAIAKVGLTLTKKGTSIIQSQGGQGVCTTIIDPPQIDRRHATQSSLGRQIHEAVLDIEISRESRGTVEDQCLAPALGDAEGTGNIVDETKVACTARGDDPIRTQGDIEVLVRSRRTDDHARGARP